MQENIFFFFAIPVLSGMPAKIKCVFYITTERLPQSHNMCVSTKKKKRTCHRIMAPRHYTHACSHGQTQGKSSLTTAAVTSARCDVERHYRPAPSHSGNLCEGVTGVSVRREGECISGWDRLRDSRGELQRLPAVKTWLRGRHCNIMFTLLSRTPLTPPPPNTAVWTSP